MLCMRCGYCCVKYSVVIINPKYINEDLNFDDPSIESKLMYKPSDEWCPHLTKKNKSSFHCSVHNKTWYKNTPCFSHTQIEPSEDSKCRMGDYVNNKNREIKREIMSLKSKKGNQK